ncbi:helix-turn-helix domain-containing protein [Paenibacillus sp. FSL M7-0896]|uniref:helix-turn-helix domain-containing protein n=1 Tax=Paenibacillus sp. FSL M7-0896 TaxID=2921610 RepID=UPI0030D7C46B
MEEDLYTLVLMAQKGDKVSLETILEIFSPVLNKQIKMVDLNEQEDLLQNLKEILIDKTLSFDTDYSPDFLNFKVLQKNK